MDFVPLIDAIGEPATIVLGGIVLGAVFGIAAQRSAFCTRTAVIHAVRDRDLRATAVWMAGFATALLLVQWMILSGHLSVMETRFFSTPQSLSGSVIGGLLFGIGMALARGCVSRLTVLAASGNLRAMFSLAVMTLAGWATFSGVFIPARDAVAGLYSTVAIGSNDLLAQAGQARFTGVITGCMLVVATIGLTLAVRASWWRVLGGALVGLAVAGGWYFTFQLSSQVFDPIATESLSFIRPYVTTLMLAVGSQSTVGLDQGLLIGVLLGAAAAAFVSREFRIATFAEPGVPSVFRYAVGAALMGFGGILAVGCTVGAGLTGGSVLAVSSLLALCAMAIGAAATDRIVDAAPRS